MINRLKMGMNLVCSNEFFQLLMMVLLISLLMMISDKCYLGF